MWGVMVMASIVGLLARALDFNCGRKLADCRAGRARVLGAHVRTRRLVLAAAAERTCRSSLAAGLMPTRWAFESLLLLESPQHAAPATRR